MNVAIVIVATDVIHGGPTTVFTVDINVARIIVDDSIRDARRRIVNHAELNHAHHVQIHRCRICTSQIDTLDDEAFIPPGHVAGLNVTIT